MKCAFCGRDPHYDLRNEINGRKYTINVGGIECETFVHDGCIENLVSEYIEIKRRINEAMKKQQQEAKQ